MGCGTAGAKCGREEHRFGNFLLACACAFRILRVNLDQNLLLHSSNVPSDLTLLELSVPASDGTAGR